MGFFDFFKNKSEARTSQRANLQAPTGTPRWAKRFFDAAKQSNQTASWPSMPVHIDYVLQWQHRTMVARSREQYANNDYVKNYIRMIKRNVVGPNGITLQAKVRDPNGKIDTLASKAIEDAWDTWGKKQNCEITGSLSWWDIQNLFVATTARDGEALLRFVVGEDAGPYGFCVQMIDPQRIPIYLRIDNLDGTDNFIRQGIEFNKYNRPIAYYFTRLDTPEFAYWGTGGPQFFDRVPADEIIHGFDPEFISQKRGIPWASSALWRLHMVKGFEHAAVTNARVSAAKMGFFTREFETQEEITDQAAAGASEQGVEGGQTVTDEDDRYTIDAEPGTWETLPIGWKPEKWDPTYPSGEFDPFNKAMLRGASAGMGVSYHSLANDLTEVNFSSIRQGALDERDEWMGKQQWLIETLHERVYEHWLRFALLSGRIRVNGKPLRADRIDKYRAVSWQPRRWQWIDPTKDVTAAVESVDNLLRSPSDIIREQGKDPEEVWAEYGRDIEAMKNSGLPEDLIMKFITGNVKPEPPKNGPSPED